MTERSPLSGAHSEEKTEELESHVPPFDHCMLEKHSLEK